MPTVIAHHDVEDKDQQIAIVHSGGFLLHETIHPTRTVTPIRSGS
jgi:hypothetical protein